jgi:hypothetical protein
MKWLIVVMLLTMIPAIASCSTESPVTYTWSAPNGGTPVVEYSVALSVDSGPWIEMGRTTTNEYTFIDIFEYGKSHEVRVAGIDAEDRQGPWSQSSDPFTPDIGINAPGQPILLGF